MNVLGRFTPIVGETLVDIRRWSVAVIPSLIAVAAVVSIALIGECNAADLELHPETMRRLERARSPDGPSRSQKPPEPAAASHRPPAETARQPAPTAPAARTGQVPPPPVLPDGRERFRPDIPPRQQQAAAAKPPTAATSIAPSAGNATSGEPAGSGIGRWWVYASLLVFGTLALVGLASILRWLDRQLGRRDPFASASDGLDFGLSGLADVETPNYRHETAILGALRDQLDAEAEAARALIRTARAQAEAAAKQKEKRYDTAA